MTKEQLRCFIIDSEGKRAISGLLIKMIRRRELAVYCQFPLACREREAGDEAEARRGVDEDVGCGVEVLLAAFEGAQADADVGMIAHQTQPSSVDRNMLVGTRRELVVRLVALRCARFDAEADVGGLRAVGEEVRRHVLRRDAGRQLAQAGRGAEVGDKLVPLRVERVEGGTKRAADAHLDAPELEVDVQPSAEGVVKLLFEDAVGGDERLLAVRAGTGDGMRGKLFHTDGFAVHKVRLVACATRQVAFRYPEESFVRLHPQPVFR